MRRTIETILPTLKALNGSNGDEDDACNVMIHGFYFESEGVSRDLSLVVVSLLSHDIQELTLIILFKSVIHVKRLKLV